MQSFKFPGRGCMDDLTIERSFDVQAKWITDVLGLFFDKNVLSTRQSQTSCRSVQELNVCTVACDMKTLP